MENDKTLLDWGRVVGAIVLVVILAVVWVIATAILGLFVVGTKPLLTLALVLFSAWLVSNKFLR